MLFSNIDALLMVSRDRNVLSSYHGMSVALLDYQPTHATRFVFPCYSAG